MRTDVRASKSDDDGWGLRAFLYPHIAKKHALHLYSRILYSRGRGSCLCGEWHYCCSLSRLHLKFVHLYSYTARFSFLRVPCEKRSLIMYSWHHLILMSFATLQFVNAYRFLEPRFYNPPRVTSSLSSFTPTTDTNDQFTSPAVPAQNSAFPSGAIACVPAIQTFTLTHASISACPDCIPPDRAAATNQSVPDVYNFTNRTLENFEFRFLNPTPTAEDISCHLTWDTSLASPDKYPIAKQMFCDNNTYNQLNAVLEKQASGVTAGFYLFVWNK